MRTGALNSLGYVLRMQGDMDAAIAVHRRALEINPQFTLAHRNLGHALQTKGDLDGASAAFRKARESDPTNIDAACDLAQSCNSRASSPSPSTPIAAARNSHLGKTIRVARMHDWCSRPNGSWSWMAACPRFLKGEVKPANAAEQIELARVCKLKRLYVDSVRFYTDAFAADPRLADNFKAGHRYDAARSAVLAGTDHRRQALDWLR